jgi:hypothetical protein
LGPLSGREERTIFISNPHMATSFQSKSKVFPSFAVMTCQKPMGALGEIIQEDVECLRRIGKTIWHIQYEIVCIRRRDQSISFELFSVAEHGKVKDAEKGFHVPFLQCLGIKSDIRHRVLINTTKEIDGTQVQRSHLNPWNREGLGTFLEGVFGQPAG